MPRTNRPPTYRLHKPAELRRRHDRRRRPLSRPLWLTREPRKIRPPDRRVAVPTADVHSGQGKWEPSPAHDQRTGPGLLPSRPDLLRQGWKPTSEQDNIRQVLHFLRLLYGTSSALDFGPLALKNVRQAMIEARRSRKLINKDINSIRGMFGWAVENELLRVQVHQTLQRVKGLRKGRSEARETAGQASSRSGISAILPQLSPQVAAMVQIQHLCGSRPQEIISIRPCEITAGGDIWMYQPSSHKTQHFDRGKVIMIGPRAQAILEPWLDRDPESYCSVPAEVVASHYRRNRSRKKDDESLDRKEAKSFKRPLGKRYTRHSYRIAIQRACRRAGIPVWSPQQLRHSRATAIRQIYGLEAAKSVLGHTDTKITEIYADSGDIELATQVMKEIG